MAEPAPPSEARWYIVVGIDPSEVCSGWCVLGQRVGTGRWVHLASGQCAGPKVVDEVMEALPAGKHRVKVLAVETIFKGVPRDEEGNERRVRPPTYYKMGRRAGIILGRLHEQPGFDKALVWEPEANEWRDVLKVRRGRRKVVNNRMLGVARMLCGYAMEGPAGGKQVDRANAVGIAYAALTRVVW